LLRAFFVGIAAAMLQLSSFFDVLTAVERGRDISVRAYTLGGRLMGAIESAARSGAHVAVTLEVAPSASDPAQLRRHNALAAAKLRACGADVSLEHGVHTKTVTVDGTVFLDGSNWRPGDVILRGAAGDAAHVASLKSTALENESAMLERARCNENTGAIVQTETFDRYNVVAKALRKMAERGLSPRLLVDARALRHNVGESASLAKIAAEGVDVRICDDTEKFAVAGNRAWLGSANASAAYPGHDMTDWGVVTDDPAIVAAVRDRVEARWSSARSLVVV
jgi:hypothetical protein